MTTDGLIVIAGNWVVNIFLLSSYYLYSLNTFFADKLNNLISLYCVLYGIDFIYRYFDKQEKDWSC